MDSYHCGETSDPVLVSATNGTENVSVAYKPSDAADTEYTTEKPTEPGNYTVRAIFPETDSYLSVTATNTFSITHLFTLDENGITSCACSREDVRLVETAITEVPEALQQIEELNTPEKITRVLVETASEAEDVESQRTATYDVELQFKIGDGDWINATPENFPKEGITVTLPYPEGTNASYTFTVIHMFTYGEDAGKTETLTPANTQYGVQFTVSSLSPICLGWAPPPDTPKYDVTVSEITGGTVSADSTTAYEGDTVTLTVTPESGYYLSSLTVLDKDSKALTLTNAGNGTYTFKQPAGNVTIKATFAVIHYSEPEPTVEPTATPEPTPAPTATPEPSATPAPATYTVTVPEETKGGSVAADPKSATEGTSVKLTVKAEDGYHLDSIYVADKDSKTITLKDNQDGTYTFTMPNGAVTVKATFVECSTLTFPDLDPTAWYHTHTDYVISHGLMNGNEKGLFEPDGTVTRAQMVTLLWNLQNKPQVDFHMAYADVSSDAWYAEAVRWATSEGIVAGYSDGSFAPDVTLTREQMATMLYQYNKKYGDGGFTGTWMFRLPFTDLTEISEWAYEGVAWCYMNKVMSGKGADLFDPQGIATRAEMAAILTQYLKLGEKPE